MLIQATGLLLGSGFVVWVGLTDDVKTLLGAMTLFGLCKGFYDSNIFAGIYDVVHPRARGTAAGIMNTVGWTGGALGPVYAGWMAKYGSHGSEMANLSYAIAYGGAVYVAGGMLLVLAALLFAKRDVSRKWDPV